MSRLAKGDRLGMSEFFAPLPLGAVALMGINDHVLKARLHNALTGKLSDLAGCFFLPLFVSALLGLGVRWRLPVRVVVGGVVTAALFTVLELSTGADAVVGRAMVSVGSAFGAHRVAMTRDVTDLLALAMVPLGCWYGLRRGHCLRVSEEEAAC